MQNILQYKSSKSGIPGPHNQRISSIHRVVQDNTTWGEIVSIPSSIAHSPIHHNHKYRYIIMKHSEMIQRYATQNIDKVIIHQRTLKKLPHPSKKITMCQKHTIMKIPIKYDLMTQVRVPSPIMLKERIGCMNMYHHVFPIPINGSITSINQIKILQVAQISTSMNRSGIKK